MGEGRQITTLGSLMAFAMALEARAQGVYAGEAGTVEGSALASLWERHGHRRRQLERMLREDLNEVTLEPISGMDPARYGWDGLDPVGAEEALGSFYADASERGRSQLGHLARTFQRFAAEGRDLAKAARRAASVGK